MFVGDLRGGRPRVGVEYDRTIAEAAGLGGEFSTYAIRSLLSEGRLKYTTVEKTAEGMRSRRRRSVAELAGVSAGANVAMAAVCSQGEGNLSRGEESRGRAM